MGTEGGGALGTSGHSGRTYWIAHKRCRAVEQGWRRRRAQPIDLMTSPSLCACAGASELVIAWAVALPVIDLLPATESDQRCR
jgi:hypothetical protein